MPNISPDSWHYRIWCWYIQVMHKGARPAGGENLCHYMRVVLIYAPLLRLIIPLRRGNLFTTPIVMAIYSTAAAYLAYMDWLEAEKLSKHFFGDASLLTTIVFAVLIPLGVIVGLACFGALCLGVMMIPSGIRALVRAIRHINGTQQQPTGRTSFFRLVIFWLLALKRKVCPMLNMPAEVYDTLQR